MKVIFFSKRSKFGLHFKSDKNNLVNDSFLDNCSWIGCAKLSLIRREYFSSAVNMLINSRKILYITKGDILQLNFIHIDK